MHGFSLAQWADEHGREAYLSMLQTVAELVAAESLRVHTRTVHVADLDAQTLRAALGSHRAVQEGGAVRERTTIVFGDESAANEVYFDLQAAIRQLGGAADEETGNVHVAAAGGAPPPVEPAGKGRPRASARWTDAIEMLAELKLDQYAPQARAAATRPRLHTRARRRPKRRIAARPPADRRVTAPILRRSSRRRR